MTKTPLAELPNLAFIGLRNAGKSSCLNNLLEREVAIVSSVAGTTTDPVTRRMELGSLGAVSLTDTAGLDDEGHLGEMRNSKSQQRFQLANFIFFVSPGHLAPSEKEEKLFEKVQASNKPYLVLLTHSDQTMHPQKELWLQNEEYLLLDNKSGDGFGALKKRIQKVAASLKPEITPLEGLVKEGALVVLVTPIDLAAPKGRLILPQVETIRDLLDRDCSALIVKERELKQQLDRLKNPPDLVITDSQAFHKVAADLAPEIPLTSFSILFARKKGDLGVFIQGVKQLESLPEEPRILMMEACSHHRQADDIGTVKIPRLFKQLVHSGAQFSHTRDIPTEEELKNIDLVIHCGACMQSRLAMENKLNWFVKNNTPIVNYGLFLAWANGLLPQALRPIPEAMELWNS